MGSVPLVIVPNKIVERVVATLLLLNTPKQEGADRIASHQAVEQPRDLHRRPNELSLDGGQHVPMSMDTVESLCDRDWRLEWHPSKLGRWGDLDITSKRRAPTDCSSR